MVLAGEGAEGLGDGVRLGSTPCQGWVAWPGMLGPRQLSGTSLSLCVDRWTGSPNRQAARAQGHPCCREGGEGVQGEGRSRKDLGYKPPFSSFSLGLPQLLPLILLHLLCSACSSQDPALSLLSMGLATKFIQVFSNIIIL